MKIPLQYVAYRICLPVSFSTAHVGLKQVVFIIDTGSNNTFISQGDAMRLNIPIGNTSFQEHVNMAGSTYELRKMRDVILRFKNDQGKLETIKFNEFNIALSTQKDQKNIDIANAFPSIIGNDFLTTHKFSLHFTPHKNEAYFERDDS
jgi:hypothetical protein